MIYSPYLPREHGCILCSLEILHRAHVVRVISGGGPPVSPPPPPPVREPHLVATPPGAVAGSMWVEVDELHYIASDGKEFAETGTSLGVVPGAVPGSIWEEGDDIHYIAAPGGPTERTISKTSMPAAPAGAITGSMWVENSAPTNTGEQFQWIAASLARWRWWNGVA